MVESREASKLPQVAVERLARVPNSTTQKDLKKEVSKGSLKNLVRNYRRRGLAVGVKVSHIPGQARIFIAEHPWLIASGVAAAAGSILIYEKYKSRKKKL